MTKKKEEPKGIALPLMAGVLAGLAGAYFIHGQGKVSPAAKKKLKGWMLKAKGEAIEKIEKLKTVDEEAYHKVIDTVAEKYAKIKDIDPNEVQELVKDMKKHWKSLVREMQPKPKKKSASKAKKVATSTVATAI
jgi:glycerol-3-phosphate responsive antiterminator